MEETELQLLGAIRSGDKDALRRLYDRYSGYAMAVGLRYIPDREQVQDVLQDSFVRILTSVGQFSYHGEGSLRAWVARIVANRAIDWLKEHERMRFADEMPDTADELPAPADDDLSRVEDVPPELLNRMIGRLPGGCRMVLNLFVFEHLSHREIARRLGIQEGSSASQLSRARKMLSRMMDEYLDS